MSCRCFIVLLSTVILMTAVVGRDAHGQCRACYPPAYQPCPGPSPEIPLDEEGRPLPPRTEDYPTVQPATDYFAMAGSGPGGATETFAPNMIGDQMGGAGVPIFSVYPPFDDDPVVIGSGAGAAVVGRMKLSDNNSPMPRDRVFFDYNYFRNAALTARGIDVHRFTPGFEKTFWDGMMSVELRVPILSTLGSDVLFDDAGDVVDPRGGEFGNMSVILKSLLWYNQTTVVSAGLGVTVPTGDDLTVSTPGGTFATVSNDSVHLTPYFAVLAIPNDILFFQAFLQVDVDANGNRVSVANSPGDTLQPVGRFRDQTLLHLDVAAGAWLYRNPYAGSGLTGLAAMFEAHYNQSLNEMASIESNNTLIGRAAAEHYGLRSDLSVVNLTAGLTAVLGQYTTVTAAYGTPASSQRLFDGEWRAFINRYF